MQLLYIWIEDFGIIKTQGFQFSSTLRVTYTPSTLALSISKNDSAIPDYFRHQELGFNNILEVTAIVGANGSGKSSILDFICLASANEGNFKKDWPTHNGILVYRYENQLLVYHDKTIKLFPFDETSDSWKVHLNNPQRIVDKVREFAPLHLMVGVYYSPNTDERVLLRSLEDYELFNISHSYRYYEDNNTNGFINEENRSSYKKTVNPRWHKIEEYKRQLKFVIDNRQKRFVEVPFAVNAYINFSIIQSFSWTREFKDLMELYDKRAIPSSDVEFLKAKIVLAVCLNYIRYNKQPEWSTEFNPFFLDLLANSTNVFIACKEFLQKHPLNRKPKWVDMFNNGHSVEVENYKVPEIIEYIDFIQESFHAGILLKDAHEHIVLDEFRKHNNFNPYSIRVKIEYAREMLGKYQKTLCEHVTDHIDFSWEQMSTGELAFLTLFSRFYFFNNELVNLERFKYVRPTEVDTLFVMIDEGDAFFHPQWQKQYLYYLLPFMARLFQGVKIQLVLTSHSSFLVSDLPNANIIFIDKQNGLTKVKDSLNQMKLTLGANIHTLLTDSFFIADGLMGEFAKSRINSVVNKLLSDQPLSYEDLLRAKHLIANIGEPIIRNKLSEIVVTRENNLKEEEFHLLQNELRVLKKQIEMLKVDQRNKPSRKSKKNK